MARPWMKWYPADWRAEPRLRMCSLAARGLWIDLLSYMHEGEPYGHLTIDGIQPNEAGIAALVARPLKEVKRAIGELEAMQVFSRAENGAIYSRRMVRDKAKADQDAAHGKAGGNPQLKPPDNGGVNPPDKAQKLEARTQKEREEEDAADAATRSALGNGHYAFQEGVIRLTEKDFSKWKEAFERLDLAAELIALAPWAADQPHWFHAVSGALAKKNREARARMDAVKNGPVRPKGYIEGII